MRNILPRKLCKNVCILCRQWIPREDFSLDSFYKLTPSITIVVLVVSQWINTASEVIIIMQVTTMWIHLLYVMTSSCCHYLLFLQYVCSCLDGYHGNGTTCILENICVDQNGGCHENVRKFILSRIGSLCTLTEYHKKSICPSVVMTDTPEYGWLVITQLFCLCEA